MKILETALKEKATGVPSEKNIGEGALRYAVEALGAIGDRRASLPIARLLDSSVPYVNSYDWLYLEAIGKTKGEDSLPLLQAYLTKLVEKMPDQPEDLIDLPETGNRQGRYNELVYRKTIGCLEAITGIRTIDATRRDVLVFWQAALNERH